MVKKGTKIKQDHILVKVEIEKVKEVGYQVITPVIITNTSDYWDVIAQTRKEKVQAQGSLLKLIV